MSRWMLSAGALRATAAFLAPAGTALAIALVVAPGAWLALLAGALAACVVAAMLARRHLRDIEALAGAVKVLGEREAVDGGPSVKPTSSLLCAGLNSAIATALRARDDARGARADAVARDEAVLEALPDALLMISAEGRVVRANAAAETLFESRLAGRDLPAVIRNPTLLEAAGEVVRARDGRIVEFQLPGAVTRYLAARVVRLPRPARDGTAAIIALHDLTALKRAEQMRGDFVANASHELRTPLASLLGFIETLRGPAREDPDARERFLAVMHDQAARMARLVEDLLSLSRIELQEHSPPRGAADVGNILRSAASTLEPLAAAKEMRIDLDILDLPPVAGDADELAQIFQNLIDNAIKYGRTGTAVRVRARPVETGSPGARRLGRPGVAVSVADTGEGIAHEHIPRLTERFYRVDAARSRKLGGTGLGLAIVKHILTRHRGILDIDSTPGEGSRFKVYLPCPAEAPTVAPSPPAGPAR